MSRTACTEPQWLYNGAPLSLPLRNYDLHYLVTEQLQLRPKSLRIP